MGRPEPLSAATRAVGPGTGTTFTPRSSASATSFSPGSLMPGLPASVTSAQSAPASSRSRIRPARWPSAKAGRLTVSAATPKCSSSTRECRVSSHAMKATALSVSRARGDRSPRFPMGVATR